MPHLRVSPSLLPFPTFNTSFLKNTVIGERLVTPSAIVYLVVKLRLVHPMADAVVEGPEETDVEVVKRELKRNEEKDSQFLIGQTDAEDLPDDARTSGWAHAPYWPAVRCLFFTTRIILRTRCFSNRTASPVGGLFSPMIK
jgi:hypothetical protein